MAIIIKRHKFGLLAEIFIANCRAENFNSLRDYMRNIIVAVVKTNYATKHQANLKFSLSDATTSVMIEHVQIAAHKCEYMPFNDIILIFHFITSLALIAVATSVLTRFCRVNCANKMLQKSE